MFAVALGVVGLIVVLIAVLSDRFEGTPDPTSGGAIQEEEEAEGGARTPPPAKGDGYEIVRIRPGEEVIVFDEPVGEEIGTLDEETAFGSPRALSLDERQGPWLGVETELAGTRSLGWIRFSKGQVGFGTTAWSIQVRLSDPAVELRKNGEVVDSYPARVVDRESIPTGRHAVSDKLPGGGSPELGAGALALTAVAGAPAPDSPSGDRVVIAGGQGEAATVAGLRLDDDDVGELLERVPIGAPVFIQG